MEYFLVNFTINGAPLAKIAVYDFDDTALLLAWQHLRDTLLDQEEAKALDELLLVASESDDPITAFEQIQLKPQENVDEIIAFGSFEQISRAEYEAYKQQQEKEVSKIGDLSLYIAMCLTAQKLLLVTAA